MLGFPKKTQKFIGKAQSGFYLDFFLKKLADVFIRNIFIYMSLFFGEKYMIEVITKKIIDNFVFNSNMYIGFSFLNNRWFFYISVATILYVYFIIHITLYIF